MKTFWGRFEYMKNGVGRQAQKRHKRGQAYQRPYHGQIETADSFRFLLVEVLHGGESFKMKRRKSLLESSST